jgi:hypothetical protein
MASASLIEPLGLKKQAAVEEILRLAASFSALLGLERGQARFIHLVKHLRGLAEGDGIEAAGDAFQRIGRARPRIGIRCRLARRRVLPLVFQSLSFAVVGAQLQACAPVRSMRFGRHSMALEADGEIEVVVGGVGVGGNGLAKQRRSVVALTAHGDTLIVDHLGQRQNPRHAAKACSALG